MVYWIWILLLFGSSLSIAQNATQITTLPCKTWGQPDWNKLENYARKIGLQKTGATIREYDSNIRSVSFRHELQSYNNEAYLRWLLQDTAIYYDIKLINNRRDILYETTSNQCGLNLPINLLTNEKSDILYVSIERNNAYNQRGFNWGISFSIKPLSNVDKQSVVNEMAGAQFFDSGKPFALVDFFIKKGLSLDALTSLEHLFENDPTNSAIIQKYWDTVNDLHINKL